MIHKWYLNVMNICITAVHNYVIALRLCVCVSLWHLVCYLVCARMFLHFLFLLCASQYKGLVQQVASLVLVSAEF